MAADLISQGMPRLACEILLEVRRNSCLWNVHGKHAKGISLLAELIRKSTCTVGCFAIFMLIVVCLIGLILSSYIYFELKSH